MRPHFILIGAMKSGTTSLFRYVASHPDVSPSSIKETDFFTTERYFRRGGEWYRSLFRGTGAIAFEASPNYAKRHLFSGVPARMHSVLPHAHLGYVLRDPIDRAVSHYVHNRSTGRESRTFSESIRDPASPYIQTGKYFYQLEAFLECYHPKQILLLDADRLRRETARSVNDIFRFLGLPPAREHSVLTRRFHVTRGRDLRVLSGTTRGGIADGPRSGRGTARSGSGTGWAKSPQRRPGEQVDISSADRQLLFNALAPDVGKLRRFAGLDFPGWSL